MNDTDTALILVTEDQALEMTDEEAERFLEQTDLTPPGTDEHVTADDIPRNPRLRVAQNRITDLEIDAGVIYNDVSGASYGEAVEASFLAWLKDARILWPKTYDKDNNPLCASNDGVNPATSSSRRKLDAPEMGPCAQCAKSKFGENGEAPRCKRQRNCVLWLVEDQEVVQLTIHGMGLTPAKRLTDLAEKCSVRSTIWVTSKYEENDKGQYYVLLYSKGKKENHTQLSVQQQVALSIMAQHVAKMETMADTSRAEGGYTPADNADIVEGKVTDAEDDLPF